MAGSADLFPGHLEKQFSTDVSCLEKSMGLVDAFHREDFNRRRLNGSARDQFGDARQFFCRPIIRHDREDLLAADSCCFQAVGFNITIPQESRDADELSPLTEQLQALLQGAVSDCIDDQIKLSVCPVADGGCVIGICIVEAGRRTECPHIVEIPRAADPMDFGAPMMGELNEEASDSSRRAIDEDAFTLSQPPMLMQRLMGCQGSHGQGCRGSEIDPGGEGGDSGIRRHDKFGVAAGTSLAVVGAAEYAIAFTQARDPFSHAADDPGGIEAEDIGEAGLAESQQMAFAILPVGWIQARIGELDLNFSGSGFGGIDLIDVQDVGSSEFILNDGFHSTPPEGDGLRSWIGCRIPQMMNSRGEVIRQSNAAHFPPSLRVGARSRKPHDFPNLAGAASPFESRPSGSGPGDIWKPSVRLK